MSGFGGDQEGKALQYIADGEKVLKKWTLFSSTTKNEDAAECFDKAARCYKVSSFLFFSGSGAGGAVLPFFHSSLSAKQSDSPLSLLFPCSGVPASKY